MKLGYVADEEARCVALARRQPAQTVLLIIRKWGKQIVNSMAAGSTTSPLVS